MGKHLENSPCVSLKKRNLEISKKKTVILCQIFNVYSDEGRAIIWVNLEVSLCIYYLPCNYSIPENAVAKHIIIH